MPISPTLDIHFDPVWRRQLVFLNRSAQKSDLNVQASAAQGAAIRQPPFDVRRQRLEDDATPDPTSRAASTGGIRRSAPFLN
jgi:hypothetical protein